MSNVQSQAGGGAQLPAGELAPARAPRRPTLLHRCLRGVIALSVLVLTTAAVDGNTTNTVATAPLPMAPLPELGGSVIRVLGALAFVLALLFGGLWLARHWRRLLPAPSRAPDLRVLECRALGGRQAVWLVAYRRQRLLLGSSNQGVSLLAQLPEAESDDAMPDATPDFAIAFQNLLQRKP